MPIAITNTRSAVPAKGTVDAFRKKIPNGQGYNLIEVSEKLGVSIAQLRKVFVENKWAIRRFVPGTNNRIWLLVNPTDLKKYANEN